MCIGFIVLNFLFYKIYKFEKKVNEKNLKKSSKNFKKREKSKHQTQISKRL